MPQKAFTGSLTSSHLLYLSFPLNLTVPALNQTKSSHIQHLSTSNAANRRQGLRNQGVARREAAPAASWLRQLAPPPSQPVVNSSSASLTFAFSTEILHPLFKQNHFNCL